MDCKEKLNLKLPAHPGFLWDRATATGALFWDTINGTLEIHRKTVKILQTRTSATKAFLPNRKNISGNNILPTVHHKEEKFS
jgi:hypothetical protein